ncbi:MULTISPECIES: SDR family NAD(P)-dependent oxidoreductase [Sutcliffiella]|uniref:SDR family oxidoreductase n=1 Tax=Sutcliffiella cohnii TaxID=33932 RepID=A0A223KVM1_9BACI|nr:MULTISPECIES: SDR family oxidoreductase [Sutcliffiella]AST93506.1 hypothetical protein BC6307_20655 [Sutcliffiella cohnii]WBL14690.1 SDR family NAD(P)-dependent oxidoreductase [Sutcliffiella sp. NC1]
MEKTVLITGAASEIGQAILRRFLVNGYQVIATEVEFQRKTLEDCIRSMSIDDQQMIKFYSLDLEKDEEVLQFSEYLKDTYTISALVNIAGINILKNFFDWNVEELRKVVDINWIGTFLLTKAVAESMVAKSIAGTITTISSQHGIVVNKERVPYCISKASLIHLTKVLGLELAPYNIRVNCVSPTYVKTDKNSHILNSNRYIDEELVKIPLNRYAIPDDVADAVEFLTSPASKMITGHNLVVDGGWTIQ